MYTARARGPVPTGLAHDHASAGRSHTCGTWMSLTHAPKLSFVIMFAIAVCACGGSGTVSLSQVPPTVDDPAPRQLPREMAALQPGQWFELPNTTIRSVLPDPPPRGTPTTITQAWSGGTVDTHRS